MQVFGQQNLLILKQPEFKGALGPLSKYVYPSAAYEKAQNTGPLVLPSFIRSERSLQSKSC